MPDSGGFTFLVEDHESGKRLDALVAIRIPEFSRSRAALLIQNGNIRVEGAAKKPGYRVKPDEEISGTIPRSKPPKFEPEPIQIDILYEDTHLIVINKQPGLVIHPAPGHPSGTLVNALLYHCPDLEGVGAELRPGIVHRLDRDTSGVLVVAKNEITHRIMSSQFKSRRIEKNYLALVHGEMETESGSISLAVGRHPVDRKKMSVKSPKGRTAETFWQVKERFEGATLLDLSLKTGRTHQIRVHCAAIHHPIIGDAVYGGGRRTKKKTAHQAGVASIISSEFVTRQMLHARRIQFMHPVTQEIMSIRAPVPQDMEKILQALRAAEKSGESRLI